MDEFETGILGLLAEEKEKDEFDKFCESIAPKLRRINDKDPRTAARAQMEIQKVLFNLEFD